MSGKGPRARRAVAAASLLAVVTAVYWGSLDNPFHYDDTHSIVENPHVRSLANVPAYFVDPEMFSADPQSAMYRPLVLVSYAVNYALSGYRTGSYHWANLLTHLGCVGLVFGVLRQLRASAAAAGAGAALFALHPVQAETVNYISSRSESLCALFCLASLATYARAVAPPAAPLAGARRRRAGAERAWILVSIGAAIAALLCKSVGIVVPGLLLAYEGLHRGAPRARRRQVVVRLAPYVLVASAYLLLTRRFIGAALWSQPLRGLGTQLLTQAKALVYYLLLLATPVHLSVEHQFRLATGGLDAPVLAAAALLASAVALAQHACRTEDRRSAVLWLAWPLVALLPTLVVPLNVLVNEHRLYLSVVALSGLAGLAWQHGAAHRDRRPLLVAGVVLCLLFCVLDAQRTAVWGSPRSLWGSALARAPLMPRPHLYMGDQHAAAGDAAQALQEYRAALAVYPELISPADRLIAHNNAGAVLLKLGRWVEAVDEYQRALEIDSTYARARDSLEGLLAVQHEHADPQAERLRKQGLFLLVSGDPVGAAAALRQSLALQSDPQTWMGLAMAFERCGNREAAVRAYQALRLVGRGTTYATTAEDRIRRLRNGG